MPLARLTSEEVNSIVEMLDSAELTAEQQCDEFFQNCRHYSDLFSKKVITNDLHLELITAEIEVLLKGVQQVSYPKDIPDPTKPYELFLVDLMKCTSITNLHHYRMAGGKHARLWMASAGQHIHTAMQDGLVTVDVLEGDGGERLNSYHPTDGARTFWSNAAEEGHEPLKCLEGWRAMQSILKDVDKEATGAP